MIQTSGSICNTPTEYLVKIFLTVRHLPVGRCSIAAIFFCQSVFHTFECMTFDVFYSFTPWGVMQTDKSLYAIMALCISVVCSRSLCSWMLVMFRKHNNWFCIMWLTFRTEKGINIWPVSDTKENGYSRPDQRTPRTFLDPISGKFLEGFLVCF